MKVRNNKTKTKCQNKEIIKNNKEKVKKERRKENKSEKENVCKEKSGKEYRRIKLFYTAYSNTQSYPLNKEKQ